MTPCGRRQTSRRSRSQSTSSWRLSRVSGTRLPLPTPRPAPSSWTRSPSPGWRCSAGTRWSSATGAPPVLAPECSTWATPAISTPPFRWDSVDCVHIVWWIVNLHTYPFSRHFSTLPPWWTIWNMEDTMPYAAAMDTPHVQFVSWVQLSGVRVIISFDCEVHILLPWFAGTSSQSPMKPIKIYEKLKVICKHLVHGRQEDAHEFLRYMISFGSLNFLKVIRPYNCCS